MTCFVIFRTDDMHPETETEVNQNNSVDETPKSKGKFYSSNFASSR